MARHHQLTDEQVIAAHGTALTSVEMAQCLGVHPHTVSNYLRRLSLVAPGVAKAGVKHPRPLTRTHPQDAARQRQLQQAFTQGYRTLQSVADEMGISRERVRQICIRYGFIRPKRP